MDLDTPSWPTVVILAVAVLAIANPFYLYQQPDQVYSIAAEESTDTGYANNVDRNVTFADLNSFEHEFVNEALASPGTYHDSRVAPDRFETLEFNPPAFSGGPGPMVYGLHADGDYYVLLLTGPDNANGFLSEHFHSTAMSVIGFGLLLVGGIYARGRRSAISALVVAIASVVVYVLLVINWTEAYRLQARGDPPLDMPFGLLFYLLCILLIYGFVLVQMGRRVVDVAKRRVV